MLLVCDPSQGLSIACAGGPPIVRDPCCVAFTKYGIARCKKTKRKAALYATAPNDCSVAVPDEKPLHTFLGPVCLLAVPDGKPVPTFPGTALIAPQRDPR